MANLKISALSAGVAPDANADVFPVVQGGTTKKVALGQFGGIIAWARATQTASDYVTTSASYVDVDATNLKVTFTAPPSGKVVIQANVDMLTASNQGWMNLRDSGGDVANTGRIAEGWIGAEMNANMMWTLTGLTPGTSYTYKLGYKILTSGTVTIRSAATHMPTMVVWAVPG